jgi:hypothetical protein
MLASYEGMSMTVEMDPDVQRVAEFIQTNFAAQRLVSIAESVAALAPALWGQYGGEAVLALQLKPPLISACDPHTPPAASE